MAWTIAIILAVVSLSTILLFISKSFDKTKHGMKVFLTMLTFGSLVLIAGIIRLIVLDKASSSMIDNLTLLSDTLLTITIVIFVFFMTYFFITYFIGIVRAIRDAKKEKVTNEWGDF